MPLPIHLPATEMWDGVHECFVTTEEKDFVLEHSLDAIRRWESKWHKCFLHENEKTGEMLNDYVKCMVTNGVEMTDLDIARLSKADIEAISAYLENPMTATTFNERQNNGPRSRDIMTAELIYYMMVEIGIPFECQYWHINQLLTLIRVYQVKQTPPKKMGKKNTAMSNANINAARRRKLGSLG